MELNKNVLEYTAEELREIAGAKELLERWSFAINKLIKVFMEVQENDPDLLQELINEMED